MPPLGWQLGEVRLWKTAGAVPHPPPQETEKRRFPKAHDNRGSRLNSLLLLAAMVVLRKLRI